MNSSFERLAQELQQLVPFRIKYKDESWEMQLLNLFVLWFCPGFLSRFTTVIGSTIYLPSRAFVRQHPESAMRTLAHETVHLMDAEKWSFFGFSLAYLFPQVLTLGIFTFPLFGPWALIFLVFALPVPAPFRFYFESRAYAMDLLTAPKSLRRETLLQATQHFSSWDYYHMYPFPEQVTHAIKHWAEKAEEGEDKDLLKVLLVYELVAEA